MKLFNRKDFKSFADSALVDEYQSSGDKKIIAVFFDRYYHLVYGVCLKYLNDREKAQDATLEIFENLISDLKRHDVNNFSAWLYSVSRNHCLMIIRRSKRDHAALDGYKSEMWVVQDEDEIERIKMKDIQLKLLEEALDYLNTQQRNCIDLFYLKGKCYREIEEITGYSNKEVKTHIQNGKRNLKQKIIQNNGLAV